MLSVSPSSPTITSTTICMLLSICSSRVASVSPLPHLGVPELTSQIR
jgi:hypothetical protein